MGVIGTMWWMRQARRLRWYSLSGLGTRMQEGGLVEPLRASRIHGGPLDERWDQGLAVVEWVYAVHLVCAVYYLVQLEHRTAEAVADIFLARRVIVGKHRLVRGRSPAVEVGEDETHKHPLVVAAAVRRNHRVALEFDLGGRDRWGRKRLEPLQRSASEQRQV